MNYRVLIAFLAVSLGFVSCRQSKDLVYLQDVNSDIIKNEILLKERPEYRLRVNDILYLRIVSPNPEVNMLFNPGGSGVSQYQYTQDRLFLEGFGIDKEGNIQVPTLGKIQVLDRTITEAKALIESRLAVDLKDATVIVKLSNFRVTLLGEVARPGAYNFYTDKVTLVDALGQAGDLTDYGNRRKVLVMRTTDDGVKPFRVNLTDSGFMMSEVYYLRPNDVIYVEPMKTKNLRLIITDYGVLITAVTSTLTTLVLILNLL